MAGGEQLVGQLQPGIAGDPAIQTEPPTRGVPPSPSSWRHSNASTYLRLPVRAPTFQGNLKDW